MRRFVFALMLAANPLWAQSDQEPEMTLTRLAAIAQAVDPSAEVFGTQISLTIADVPLLIVADPVADRMRAMVPIRSAEGMSTEELLRVMQANFDTALDARYAIARGRLWGIFIHPLSPLEKDQVISALLQTVNVARTYGQTYSSGAITYGGGDSNELFRDLLEDLLERGEDI